MVYCVSIIDSWHCPFGTIKTIQLINKDYSQEIIVDWIHQAVCTCSLTILWKISSVYQWCRISYWFHVWLSFCWPWGIFCLQLKFFFRLIKSLYRCTVWSIYNLAVTLLSCLPLKLESKALMWNRNKLYCQNVAAIPLGLFPLLPYLVLN